MSNRPAYLRQPTTTYLLSDPLKGSNINRRTVSDNGNQGVTVSTATNEVQENSAVISMPPHGVQLGDIHPRITTAPEDLELLRQRRQPIRMTDMTQVRAQLERIATLMEDSLRRPGSKRKKQILRSAEPESSQARPKYSLAAGETLVALPQIAIPPDLRSAAPQPVPKQRFVLGGVPITEELARNLRLAVYGSTVHSFSKEWKSAGFRFHFPETPYPYGLVTERNGSRGLALCVQAFIIKHLVYKYRTKEEIFSRRPLEPSGFERTQALVKALSGILWQAGSHRQRACVCLAGEEPCFATNQLYRTDGVTEGVHLFEFSKYEDLEVFIKRNLSHFDPIDGQYGCILFLYSVALSKTLHRLCEEVQGCGSLLTDTEELSQAAVNLLLTGTATPFLHNNTLVYDELGQALEKPLIGVPTRSEVGFLYWDKDEPDRARTQVGSMLKTPRLPIWVTRLNGSFGLLFSTNPDLVRDWRVEHRFQLHYFNGLKTLTRAAVLSVDTRFGRKLRAKTARSRTDEKRRIPAVEQAILSKWYGAEVDWNGVVAFV